MIRIGSPRHVGVILADLRAMYLLSQRALCADVGMQPARLSDWETGKATPSLPHLMPVLAALGFTLALVPGDRPGTRTTGTGWPT